VSANIPKVVVQSDGITAQIYPSVSKVS